MLLVIMLLAITLLAQLPKPVTVPPIDLPVPPPDPQLPLAWVSIRL
jgi:hypothetical protein